MKRLTVISGHYGAGKTEIAVNLAIDFKLDALIDLDVVNPYFRSRSVHDLLTRHGVDLIESSLPRSSGSDLPYISAGSRRPFIDTSLRAVYDLAGTKAGAKLMRQFSSLIDAETPLDFFVVINVFRPETSTTEKIVSLIQTLEGAAQLRVSGLVNNSNLMRETDASTIQQGESILREVSAETDIPIVYTFHPENVDVKESDFSGTVRPLRRYLAKTWL